MNPIALKESIHSSKKKKTTWNWMPKPIRLFFKNKKGAVGVAILTVLILISVLAPLLAPHSEKRRSGRPHEEPSMEHFLGTTKLGKDVFSQLLYGGRTSLTVGFVASGMSVFLSIVVGISAGYLGGKVDEVISFFTNVILVIPALPLIIVIASFLRGASPFVIGLVLALTGWGYGARVLRTQTLTLKQKEFVTAADLMGESRWRIILVQIFPNMLSLVVGSFVLSTIYAILAEASLEFIGLGDPSSVTWGTMLYWAQRQSALQLGAWWEIFPVSIMIMITGAALVLINFSVDEITNPQLRANSLSKRIKSFMKRNNMRWHEQ